MIESWQQEYNVFHSHPALEILALRQCGQALVSYLRGSVQ